MNKSLQAFRTRFDLVERLAHSLNRLTSCWVFISATKTLVQRPNNERRVRAMRAMTKLAFVVPNRGEGRR